MNKSKCPLCGSKHTIKYGIRNGTQTYKCVDCGYRFRNSRLPSDLDLWRMSQENKQTVAELAVSFGTSPSTIKRRLRNIVIEWEQPPLSGHGVVHIDATYWGRNDGVLTALDSPIGSILYLAFIKHERVYDYQEAVANIENRGYKIDGIIIDGLQTLLTIFFSYKIQMYQFHMKQIVKRYLTLNPRLLASRALNEIMKNIASMQKSDFTKEYTEWKEKWKGTLDKTLAIEEWKDTLPS